MKKLFGILSCIIFLSFAVELEGQIMEESDPTYTQFNIVRGSGDPDFTGDLNMNIPLLAVPGRGGLNFDINLQYVMGNGVPVSESASWVGLGWNLNMYEITCDPVWQNGVSTPDFYYHKYGSEFLSDFFYLNFPNGSTSFWLKSDIANNIREGVPQKWSGIKVQAIYETVYTNRIKHFIIYDLDGTRYIFANRLRKMHENTLWNHTPNDWNGNPNYYYVYKLTSILAPDYVDGGGESLLPGDGGTDKGNWLKLEYGVTRTVSQNFPNLIELNVLERIISPLYTASFILSPIYDPYLYHSRVRDWNHPLQSISLKDNITQTLIKTVEFYYTQRFLWLYNDGNHYERNDFLGGHGVNRISLDSLKISGGGLSFPAYKFYYKDQDFPQQTPYLFIDEWGFLTTQEYHDNPITYYYGMLYKIEYPTGGRVEFEFESDRFQKDKNSFVRTNNTITQGGLRLKKQKIYDPLTNKEQVYEYQYASTNLLYPGYGFASSDPGRTTFVGSNGGRYVYSIGSRIRNDIHYPDVTIVQPDGSKIKKYYTSACSDMEMTGGSYSEIFEDRLVESKISFSSDYSGNEPYPRLLQETHFDNFYPYAYSNSGFKSLQSNDFVYLLPYYPTTNSFVYNGSLQKTTSVLQSIMDCEIIEFDDANMYLSIYYNGLHHSRMRIVGIDNSWKRGYLSREEIISPQNVLISAIDYYYDMILKDIAHYEIRWKVGIQLSPMAFSNCAGWVRQVKKVEQQF